MIVVVGDPILLPFDGHAPAVAGGPAAAIARACVLAGSEVQLAGKVGDDPAGDEVLLSLNRDGIGHVALLRNAGLSTAIGSGAVLDGLGRNPDGGEINSDDAWTLEPDEADGTREAGEAASATPWPIAPSALAPEDLDLALRYLITFDVLVVAEPLAGATLAVAAESAAFSGAHLVIVGRATEIPAVSGDGVTVLEPPLADPDGDFAALVARYAGALDRGTPPAVAFKVALGDTGWAAAAT